jgi:hypothetical protein
MPNRSTTRAPALKRTFACKAVQDYTNVLISFVWNDLGSAVQHFVLRRARFAQVSSFHASEMQIDSLVSSLFDASRAKLG